MWIFLDDKRVTTESHNDKRGMGVNFGKSKEWVYARDYKSFCDLLVDNFDDVELISFDHDIGSWEDIIGHDGELVTEERTGKDAAEFLINYCMDHGKKLPFWFVHSDNTGGNKNIRSLLINYMFRVEKSLNSQEDMYGIFMNTIYLDR